jgi:hypothetical protein
MEQISIFIARSVLRFFFVFLSTVILSFSLTAQSAEVSSDTKDQPSEQREKTGKSVLDEAGQMAKGTTEQVSKTLAETRDRREKADYFALANYSPLDLLIPSKFGFTLGYIKSADKTWEFEYLRGSISVPFIVQDLGKMTEERFSVIGRSYFGGNSFNFSYGLSYFDFSLHLGDKLLNRVTGGDYPSIDLVEIQTLGFNLAIGNRWSFKRKVTFGIDWISWAQPVYVTNKKSAFLDYASNQQDKDDVDAAMKLIAYFPRLAFLKLQLGILF